MAEEEVMRVGRRVYVSNLAWKSSWQDLKDHFRSVGEVVYSNVIKDESGRSKGWGIVEFAQPEEAVAAISTLNGTDLGGRTILVREDREDRDVKQYNAENGIEAPAPRRPRRRRRRRGGGVQRAADRGARPALRLQVAGPEAAVRGRGRDRARGHRARPRRPLPRLRHRALHHPGGRRRRHRAVQRDRAGGTHPVRQAGCLRLRQGNGAPGSEGPVWR
ncbi:GBP1 [Auxenochlorella protothecoides x Auxenochlorella symbiontica]